MSASNEAVFHRRNKQIQDAIDGQNLKQALQLCEKRIKKGEDTRFLRVCIPQLSFSAAVSSGVTRCAYFFLWDHVFYFLELFFSLYYMHNAIQAN